MKQFASRLLCFAVVACCLLVAATSGGSAGAGTTQTPLVKVFDDHLEPVTVHVPPLVALTWVNAGARAHEVRSDSGAWQAFELQPGGQHAVTFQVTGVFPYKVDGTIRGVVVVAAAAATSSPAPSQSPPTKPGAFRYHVVVDLWIHSSVRHTDPSYESDATLRWRADYPQVDVSVLPLYQGVYPILLVDRWHASGYQLKATDPQGYIKVNFTAKRQPYCDIATEFRVPAYIGLGSGNGDPYYRGPEVGRFLFRAADFEYEFGTPFKDNIEKAIQAGCRAPPGEPYGFDFPWFPLEIGKNEFTTPDGLIWERFEDGRQVNVFRRGGSALGFPIDMLQLGKPFTMSTGKRTADWAKLRRCEHCSGYTEGLITIKFTRP